MFKDQHWKLSVITGAIALTLGIHYGFILEPIFGDSHWIHAVHGRLCYIPIVIAASWFGLRGALWAAGVISTAVLPYVFLRVQGAHNLSSELVEIVFYFAIAILAGALVDRELKIRKKHEQAQLELERGQRLSIIGQMAACVAHEIKNPLASIKGAVEIMCDGATVEKDRDEFQSLVTGEVRRIDGTVREFLEFARPKPTQLQTMNLSETVISTLRQLETQFADARIKLKIDVQHKLMVHGDHEKLRQVILNILLNALAASKEGSEIAVTLSPNASKKIALTIRDNGVGIPADELDKVFEPFYTTGATGSGLGMTVVKAIVDDHNGDIQLDSTVGAGTSVTISLPPEGDS